MNWHERTAKAYAREWLLERIEPITNIVYMGLPASEAIFEREMCNTLDVEDLYLFEKDEILFRILRANLASEEPDCDYYEVSNGDIDTADFSIPNFLWLDYCGPITPGRIEVLKRAIADVLKNDGTIAVTFMAGREKGGATSIINELDANSNIDLTAEDINGYVPEYFFKRIRAVCDIALSVHPRLKISVLPYGDHVPMILFVFKKKVSGKTEIQVEPYLKE